MVDGLARRWLKGAVRVAWTVEYGLRRRLRPAGYALAGTCGGCAKCCERPAIHAGLATFRLRLLRRAFLAWQRVVNGLELVEADEDASQFVFRCTHFDWATRRCDSYASRPFMCRDYPRALLHQPWPVLFDACGFRPLSKRAPQMLAELDAQGIPEAKRRELAKRLYLE